MPGETAIEWTRGDDGTPGATWNPVTGCTKVSAGCEHCYAERFAERFRGVPAHPYERGFDLRLWPERLEIPLRWMKPKRIFANSMSDLWHAGVPDVFIADVFAVMALAHWHTFQVLTKRRRRMQRLLTDREWLGGITRRMQVIAAERGIPNPGNLSVPIPNVWLGVSVENQEAAYRIDWLVQTPAVVRFLSCEPLLEPVDLDRWLWHYPFAADEDGDSSSGPEEIPRDAVHWVIAGGESGPGFRAVDLDWLRGLRDQCLGARVPFFYKQRGGVRAKAGGRELDGRMWDEFPKISV
jgi:protein gp37